MAAIPDESKPIKGFFLIFRELSNSPNSPFYGLATDENSG
jgi:hypothetical protein